MSAQRTPDSPRLSRRTFLGYSAAAACAAAVSQRRLAAADDPVPWTMRLATSSIHYLHLPVEQACEQIAKLDFEAVDIWSAHVGCPHLDDVAERLKADGLRKVLDGQKLKLFSFSVYAGGYARYAQLLGESGGGVAVQGSAGPCPPAWAPSFARRKRRIMDGISALARRARRREIASTSRLPARRR